ncbi:hypothetical protein BaRGS_00016142 [Batillaria attramentaria]|uniref:Uncharacterized protein n=1 Tax=Batillaria attramentaria TaxID=370345 RepID=A0ABD0L0C3_9CAEN
MRPAVFVTIHMFSGSTCQKDGCPMCDFMPMAAMGAGGVMPPMAMPDTAGGGLPTPGGLQEVERVRNLFPETWLWTNASVRCEGKTRAL